MASLGFQVALIYYQLKYPLQLNPWAVPLWIMLQVFSIDPNIK
jgi:hypothetical protein